MDTKVNTEVSVATIENMATGHGKFPLFALKFSESSLASGVNLNMLLFDSLFDFLIASFIKRSISLSKFFEIFCFSSICFLYALSLRLSPVINLSFDFSSIFNLLLFSSFCPSSLFFWAFNKFKSC